MKNYLISSSLEGDQLAPEYPVIMNAVKFKLITRVFAVVNKGYTICEIEPGRLGNSGNMNQKEDIRHIFTGSIPVKNEKVLLNNTFYL